MTQDMIYLQICLTFCRPCLELSDKRPREEQYSKHVAFEPKTGLREAVGNS
jgi:hypothetical protein